MRFANTGRSNFDKLRFCMNSCDIRATQITHARAQPAEQLVYHCQYTAFVGYASFNAFGHQLLLITFVFLEVAVTGALLHRTQATHAAIGFVGTPLI